jgi:hypothetical protein
MKEGIRSNRRQFNVWSKSPESSRTRFGIRLGLLRLKGSPVHLAPTCAGSSEGSDHFRSYVHLDFYF